eukprot:CAMPEP_0195290062 /NCGR_PEP_ID=MMETSP0707-20130614/6077_1 /TAXON_ID=33640 /ORGANISM="Asterionellopsis glacialis, Strain CCMP134" /LENGTH=359 /DNA_ID=CAMNT_0040350133 /DNA_START=204 /DNA_END=1283 /DNA_ORIENTATION=-
MTTKSHGNQDEDLRWSSLIPHRLDVDPIKLVESSPQIAKDSQYATAVQKAWKEQRSRGSTRASEIKPVTYFDNSGIPLYGDFVRLQKQQQFEEDNSNSPDKPKKSRQKQIPGIILFHTGAGPRDIFLHWKADELVTTLSGSDDDEGCVVLIADLISDKIGWAWDSDRTKYNAARDNVLSVDVKTGTRKNLQDRIQAAVNTLVSFQQEQGDIGINNGVIRVDSNRIGVMGYCFGGQPVLELGRMALPNIKAMITFHGVFDGVDRSPPPSSPPANDNKVQGNVLICNGAQDSFIPKSDLEAAVSDISKKYEYVNVLSFDGVRHGFTNPAQDYNPSEAFAYNDGAANKSWNEALSILQSSLK